MGIVSTVNVQLYQLGTMLRIECEDRALTLKELLDLMYVQIKIKQDLF